MTRFSLAGLEALLHSPFLLDCTQGIAALQMPDLLPLSRAAIQCPGKDWGCALLAFSNSDTETLILFFYFIKKLIINGDTEQLNRVFINLFKNSIESLKEKSEKKGNFQKKIDVEIQLINDYISIVVQDNGTGFTNNDPKIFSKPYFTTKKEGSGLGLSIVEKILNDHNGFIEFIPQKGGAKIKILLPKYVN